MEKPKEKLLEQLRSFIDNLESDYCGDINGFTVKLKKPITEDGSKQGYSEIEEFIISYDTFERVSDLETLK